MKIKSPYGLCTFYSLKLEYTISYAHEALLLMYFPKMMYLPLTCTSTNFKKILQNNMMYSTVVSVNKV